MTTTKMPVPNKKSAAPQKAGKEVKEAAEESGEHEELVQSVLDLFEDVPDDVRAVLFEELLSRYCNSCGGEQPEDPEEECACTEEAEEDEDEGDSEDEDEDEDGDDEDEPSKA